MQPDDLRIIPNVNTQVRYIPFLSYLVKTLNNNFLPLGILKELSIKWSQKLELEDEDYKTQYGKITKNGKTTSAFSYYINFLESLGLISRINEFTRCTKYGILYNAIGKLEIENSKIELNNAEKYFILFFLLEKDADIIFLVLDTLYNENNGPLKQSEITERFKYYLNIRLKVKHASSSLNSQLNVAEKFRKINYEWHKVKSYAKHIVSTRLEWLIYFDILKRDTEKKYYFTNKGASFYSNLPTISDYNFKDINKAWIYHQSFTEISRIFNIDNHNNIKDLTLKNQKEIITEALLYYFNEMGTDSSLRISTYPAFIYTSIYLAIKLNIIGDFADFEDILSERLETQDKIFLLRKAVRINESYISIQNR